jgi:plastocyanin
MIDHWKGAGWRSAGLLLIGVVALGAPGAAHAGGTIAGKVAFTGTPPAPKEIQFGAEKQCALAHQHGAPTYEEIIVNDNGTLKSVLVHLTDVAGEFPVPTEPVVIDQQGCVFLPHVSLVRVGQPVEFRNSDPVLHNVRGASKQKQGFNVAQPVQGSKTTRTFKNPEIGMLLRCDVHYWMSSYLHVLAHPFAAVTKDDGAFTIGEVPAGTYTVQAWHEKLGTQTQSVAVEDGQSAEVVFTFATP